MENRHGRRGDGQQIMVHRGFAYVAHPWSGGFSIVDVRDPERPGETVFIAAPRNTWTIHLQTHGDQLLVVHALDLFASVSFADEQTYHSGSMGATVGARAQDWPLALGDASSTAAQDLIASDLIFPHRRGEAYVVACNPAQRWFYIPDLRPDEAIPIECWDSDPSVARFAPHTGFEYPSTQPGTPSRQSIEFRTIAFFD